MNSATISTAPPQKKSSRSPEAKDYSLKAVPLSAIRLNDGFWAPRVEANWTVTLPHVACQCESSGRVENFRKASGEVEGYFQGNPFDDSDVFKTIEAVSYILLAHEDGKLEDYVDGLIHNIQSAQEEDGYLYTPHTAGNPETVEQRWSNLMWSHELYNLGTLYEAAVAYSEATGKQQLMAIAIKSAEMVDFTFGPKEEQLHEPDGHEEIEVGLVKLYRETGRKNFLELANYFIDQRGTGITGKKDFLEYSQDHKRVTEQKEAVGHAVRAAYLYMAMADVGVLMGRHDFLDALAHIWENMVSRKMYLTGGIGSRWEGEAFGGDYELPNETAYNETCAAIASVLWNQRMFQIHKQAKYVDVLERVLYNAVLSGISLDGKKFFYPNPLATDGINPFNFGTAGRREWFDCPCCPTSFIRFMPQLPGLFYCFGEGEIFVNLFGSSEVDFPISNSCSVRINQRSNYPWSGKIEFELFLTESTRFTLNLRIPGWAQGRPVPSDLYSYVDSSFLPPQVLVNDQLFEFQIKNGFAVLDRVWKSGDGIEVQLDMPVRRVVANGKVDADIGKVAIERGPIVYCVESIDNPSLDFLLPDSVVLQTSSRPDVLNGVTIVIGERVNHLGADSPRVHFTAIPYYSWNNRGEGAMKVWLDRAACH